MTGLAVLVMMCHMLHCFQIPQLLNVLFSDILVV